MIDPLFIYLLSWPDEQTMNDVWEPFGTNQEWKDIKAGTGAEHGQLVGAIRDQVLIPLPLTGSGG